MVMSPPNILEVMSFRLSTRVTATVCCILMQILCLVSQKSFSFVPRSPTGALLLDPAGGLSPPDPLPRLHPWTPLGYFHPPDSQSSFMSPQ